MKSEIKSTREYWLQHEKAKRKTATLNSRLKREYGISLRTYNRMLEEQNGVCAICGQPETVECKGIVKSLSVDHDHKTGKVRGLICARCNTAIGLLKDDPFVFYKSKLYLEGERISKYTEFVYTQEGWQERGVVN